MARKRIVFITLLVTMIGITLWYAAARIVKPAPLEAGERPNIVMVVIETLRADHMQAYGYPRLTMPVAEFLGMEGTVFERATSAASWTLPSVASILTGLPPSAHGVRAYEDQIPEEAETLAERLKEVGYHTAFLGVNSLFEADRKVKQGFDYYYGTDEIGGEELNQHLMAWMKDFPRDKPVFLYVHYFDPHCRYIPPEEYRQMYWPPDPKLATGRKMTREQHHQMHECFQLFFGPNEPVLDVDYYLAEYDAELRHVDHVMGLFLERLKTAGLYDSSLLFFLGDHGEEFYEHDGFGHGKVLYEDQVWIPLFIRMPGGSNGGQRISGRVSTLDLYPTAMATAGLEPDEDLPGLNLLPILEGGDASSLKDRAVFSETDYEKKKQRAVLQGRWKLLVSPNKTHKDGLYDLESDPQEMHDLSEQQPAIKKQLLDLLKKEESRALELGRDLPGSRQELTEQTLEQLRSLGYVE